MLQNLLCVPNYSLLQIHRLYGSGAETHYDILNLKRNCTAEEIRKAFIKLSKEFHPDVKGVQTSPKDAAKFVRISEAYQILSKSVSRNAYDQDLQARGMGHTFTAKAKEPEVHRPWEIKPDYDPNPGAYYGIRGLKRVSNAKVVMILVAFAMASVGLGAVSINYSMQLNQSQLDEKSKEAGDHHAVVRANAQKFGNHEQLKRMVDRLLSKTQ